MLTLKQEFFKRESISVAKDLLGKYLVREIDGVNIIGKIVETECYLPFIDPAAHSFIRKTPRTAVLFGEAGYSYVYSIHKYFCLNVVCEAINIPGSVLIRSLEPIQGIDFMISNRLKGNKRNLTNGPGKLCQALQINKKLNSTNLVSDLSELKITEGDFVPETQIVTTTRIGISKAQELPLRFYIKDNEFVSKLKK